MKRVPKVRVGVLCIALLLALTCRAEALYYTFQIVVKTGDTIGGKTLTHLSQILSINDNGVVAFAATFSDGTGVFKPNSVVVLDGDTVGGITLTDPGSPSLANNGSVAYSASFPGGSVVVVPGKVPLKTGDTLSGVTLTVLGNPSLTNSHAAFYAQFSGMSGIFDGDGQLVVKSGDTIGGKTLSNVGPVLSLNDQGDMAFYGYFAGKTGIFTQNSQLVQVGELIGGKTLTQFQGPPSINNKGAVAFYGYFDGGQGIFTQSDLLVKVGDIIGGEALGEALTGIGNPVLPFLDDQGGVAFQGFFDGGNGIFTSTNLIARTDDTIGGKKLTFLGVPSLSKNGKVAFYAQCSDGSEAIILANPVTATPGKATLIVPSGTISSYPPTYTWNSVPYSWWYYLWVDDSTGNKIKKWYSALDAACGSSCSVTPDTSLAAGSAKWWIQTWNPNGYGPWSNGMTFTVPEWVLPTKANLESPSGAINTNTPVYTWDAEGKSTWYRLWVNDSTGNKIQTWYTADQVGCGSFPSICSVLPDTPLVQGNATWWVRTWNPSGYGPWSNAMSFNVPAPVLPGKVTLMWPVAVINTNTPGYSWTADAHSTWYYLWVDDSTGNKIKKWYSALDAGCGSGTGACAVAPNTPLAAGSAKWWIQAWSPNGYGSWSDAMGFAVLLQSP